MSGEAFVNSAWRTISSGEVRIGGAWKSLTRGEIYKDGAWHSLASFVSPLSLSISPNYAFGSESNFKPTTVRSNFVIATPSGGAAPYTYSWTATGVAISNPTSATTQFSASLGAGVSISTGATCVVTDAHGATASDGIAVELSNEG